MSESHDGIPRIDVRGLAPAAAVILVAKSVRFLSRGTTVLIDVDDASVAAELAAWTAWIGHEMVLPNPREEGASERNEVTLVVRAANGAQI